ncbi:MAG: glycosyltransferase [Treponema sp.]|nr:glycosyltransferase [Treponema sp.]
MTVCILAPRFPYPEIGGDILRLNSIAKYFKSIGYKVVIISFYDKTNFISDKDIPYDRIYKIKRNKIVSLFFCALFLLLGKPIQCGYYFSFRFNKLFKKVIKIENPDIYVSHLLRMEPYLKINKLKKNVIIEMTDALSKTYDLSSKAKHFSLKRVIYQIEKERIKKMEKDVINYYPKIVLVSKNDIDYLNNDSKLYLYPLGVNTYYNTKKYNNNKICFVGNMRTLQNQDAVMFFYKEIYPEILKFNKNAEFHIVGAEPPSFIKELSNNKNIFVTGFVDSVEEYIADSCFLIAPVNIAAGVQYKVLTGMGQRIPVILSSLIAKAIPELKNEVNCFIANNNEDYIKYVKLLMNDSSTREFIAENGYKVINNNYSILAKLKGYEIIDNI